MTSPVSWLNNTFCPSEVLGSNPVPRCLFRTRRDRRVGVRDHSGVTDQAKPVVTPHLFPFIILKKSAPFQTIMVDSLSQAVSSDQRK